MNANVDIVIFKINKVYILNFFLEIILMLRDTLYILSGQKKSESLIKGTPEKKVLIFKRTSFI